jgi:hypothetical protein
MNPEKTTEMAMVTANCLYRAPVMPPRRAADLVHGPLGGVLGREVELDHVALGVFHHDYGIVHHQPYGQDHAEQGQHVDGEAEDQHAHQGPEDGDRDRQGRDDGQPQAVQEDEDHQHHQDHGLEEGLDDLLDRSLDEQGGVQGHLVVEPLGEGVLQLRQGGPHVLGHLDGIGPGLLIDGDQGCLLALELGIQGIALGPKLRIAHILDPDQGRVLVFRPHDHVVELGRLGDGAGGDGKGLGDRVRRRGVADAPHGKLLILVLDDIGEVRGGDAQLGHAVRLEPDAHGVFGDAEDGRLVGAVDTGYGAEDLGIRVIGDGVPIQALVRREEGQHHQEGAGLLHHIDPLRLDRLRE